MPDLIQDPHAASSSPHQIDEVTEETADLTHPQNVEGLKGKINSVLMTTTDPDRRQALEMIAVIAHNHVVRDETEGANVDFYNRLANQVMVGKRGFHSLTAAIDGVRGVSPEIARLYGLPLNVRREPVRRSTGDKRGGTWNRHTPWFMGGR